MNEAVGADREDLALVAPMVQAAAEGGVHASRSPRPARSCVSSDFCPRTRRASARSRRDGPQPQDLSSRSHNRLSEDDARALAERFLSRVHPAGTGDLRYLGATEREWKSRTDRTFTWEREGIDWKGGRYRHKVVVQGDRVGGYEEFVQVPEAWSRDYMQLRSKNDTAGAVDTVFFLLTMLAMVVMIFLRIRGHLIRWRFAVTFGIVGAVLSVLTSLNSLPQRILRVTTRRAPWEDSSQRNVDQASCSKDS